MNTVREIKGSMKRKSKAPTKLQVHEINKSPFIDFKMPSAPVRSATAMTVVIPNPMADVSTSGMILQKKDKPPTNDQVEASCSGVSTRKLPAKGVKEETANRGCALQKKDKPPTNDQVEASCSGVSELLDEVLAKYDAYDFGFRDRTIEKYVQSTVKRKQRLMLKEQTDNSTSVHEGKFEHGSRKRT